MTLYYYIGSYIIGSLSAAILICRALGLMDPRSYGSKNAGAANVSRQCGKWIGLLVLILDAMKGVIVAVVVQLDPFSAKPSLIIASIAVLVGHIYPIFFKFQGGKGVATALGIVAVVSPISALCAFVTYVIIIYFSRISSLSIFSSIFTFYFASWIIGDYRGNILLFFVLTVLILYGLRENIVRLISRRENLVP